MPAGVSNPVATHSQLVGLDYASSGHTGFAGTAAANSFEALQTFQAGVSISGTIRVMAAIGLWGASSTSTPRQIAGIAQSWVDATDAGRKGRVTHSVYDTAEREFLRADATGSGVTVASAAAWSITGGLSVPGAGTGSQQIGPGASAGTGPNNTVYGTNASVAGLSANCTVTGVGASAGSSNGTVYGAGAATSANVAAAYGSNASAANNGAAVGPSASAGAGGTATGSGAVAGNNSSAYGRGSVTTASNQYVAGSDAAPMSTVYFGRGVTSATPTEYAINGTGGSGTNIAGGKLVLAGGRGTGDAAGGSVVIQTSAPGASGSGLRALVDRLTFDTNGRAVFNTAPPTYADSAAAVAGGLAAGTVYKTAAGELRIVV